MKLKNSANLQSRDCCKECAVPWAIHPDLLQQCLRLSIAIEALQNIARLTPIRGKHLAAQTLSLLSRCK